jgi:lysozyme
MATEPRAQGIDVSYHQITVDWQAVRSAGIAFAFVKATDGANIVDSGFNANWAGAKAAGLLRGAYHYYQPAQDPLAQAENLARAIGADLGELPPVLDLEEDAGATSGLSVQVEAWLQEVERRLRRRPLIYTSQSKWLTLMRDASGQFPAWAANYQLWVADYPFQKTPQSQPLLPDGWSAWTFWQYSGSGSVIGIPVPVDLDEFNGSEADLRAWATHQLPSTRRVPKVTNQEMINAFQRAFGPAFWDVVTRAGLTGMAIPASNRALPYAGLPIDDLPDLTDADKAALKHELPPSGVVPRVTNQVMINAFSRAFGPTFWEVVTRAGLTGMADPDSNRTQPYAGPPIEDLPGLTDAEEAALKDALYVTWTHHALPGLHGPADPGGGWVREAYDVVQDSNVRAVKMLVPDLQPGEVAELRRIKPEMFITARLFSGQLNQPRGGGTPEGAGRWFANEVADQGDGNNPMNRAYNSGVRYFEVHNEPNLTTEGLDVNWRDGAEFARFFNTVVAELKPRYPEASFGFPGLSPGPVVAPRLVDIWAFLDQAQDALARADFLCGHAYWGGDGSQMEKAVGDLHLLCELYPNKLVFCTEFSNNNAGVPREQKMDEYAAFFAACQALPSNLGAMFIYVLSWRADDHKEGLLDLVNNQWRPTGLAARLGGHTF